MCNLGERCPTPHRVFFHANRPSLENPYPRHHHRPDHECPIGAAHAVHCVFRFLAGRDVADKRLCIIPATVRHHCCETNARPVNKTFRRRPEMIDGGQGSVQVTGGRGTISMVSGRELELEHCGAPVEVRSMPFVPERDLDELGRQLYGNKAEGVAEDECARPPPCDHDGEKSREDDEASQCRLHTVLGLSREHQQIHQGRPCVLADPPLGTSPSAAKTSSQPAPGSAASRPIILEEDHESEEEPDVFGDRHFYGDDGFDGEMDLDDN